MAASDFSQAQFQIIDPNAGLGAGAMPLSATDTRQLYNLGQTVIAEDKNTFGNTGRLGYCGAGEFVYCQGSNVASRGQFCHIISNSAVLLDSANSASFFPVGLAAGALSATNVFGWVQVGGIADYATATNSAFAAGIRVALGSTAGQIGSVTALGSRIHGIVPVSSYAAARSASAPNMTVHLQRPFVIGITDSN